MIHVVLTARVWNWVRNYRDNNQKCLRLAAGHSPLNTCSSVHKNKHKEPFKNMQTQYYRANPNSRTSQRLCVMLLLTAFNCRPRLDLLSWGQASSHRFLSATLLMSSFCPCGAFLRTPTPQMDSRVTASAVRRRSWIRIWGFSRGWMDVECVLSDWMDKQRNLDGSSRVLFGSHSAQ